jgi:hypothetical protein
MRHASASRLHSQRDAALTGASALGPNMTDDGGAKVI